MDQLPASVQEIADVIGRDRALHLINNLPRYRDNRPGKQCTRLILYVPQRITMEHPLVQILGFEDAAKMVNAFGGESLHPANCSGNRGGRPKKKNPVVEMQECEPQNGSAIHNGVINMRNDMHGVACA